MLQFSKNDLARLAEIVRQVTGNHVQEKNYSMLESRLRGRLIKLNLPSLEAYWSYFEKNETEEKEVLQSLMTTHYTFFFREFAHFEVLDQWIQSEHARLKERFTKNQQPVRIWSAACSRGQEVYSLAMFLEINLKLKFGVPYEVYGTDIDNESVAYGKNGVYPIKEVNTIPHQYLGPYWKRGSGAVKEFAAIHPDIKKSTHFDSANLLELDKWNNSNQFDVIFCRNVFIYFSDENVKKIALSLIKRLDKSGLFISGVSEPIRFQGWELESIAPSCYRWPQTKAHGPAAQHSTPAKKEGSLAADNKILVSAPLEQKQYHVLCVDDSPTIQILLKKIFSTDSNCVSVDIANNGREAREKLNKKKYDVMTLDIHMPEVTGIEFLEKLYNKSEDPPVLMVSSVNRTDIELATKSMSLGAFDYVEKPAMNNIQKSSVEILTKVKMALRSKTTEKNSTASLFDSSIGQKIVVPDASLCLRVAIASGENKKPIENIVKGQKNEYRSPALLITIDDNEDSDSLVSQLMGWTERSVVVLREQKHLLRPNTIYICKRKDITHHIDCSRAQNISLQVLAAKYFDLSFLKNAPYLQVLLDEDFLNESSKFEAHSNLKVSDITPSTSFASLSVEFFAKLRKAEAA